VAVLGQAAAASLFGTDEAVGRHVKVNQQWFRVIGVAGPQLAAQTDMGGLPAQDRNNVFLAFFVSASVGIIFGVYPAVRASSLDPVYALHYE